MKIRMRLPVAQNALFSFPGDHLLRAYVTAIVAAGAVAAALSGMFGDGSGDLMLIVGLVLAGAASERFKIGLFGDSHVSCSAFAIMSAAVIGGPRDAVLVAAILGLAVNLGGPVPVYKSLFNVATFVLSAIAFIAVLEAGDGATGIYRIIPLTVAGVADYLVNALLVAGAASLASRQSMMRLFREKYAWLAPHYLPLGAVLYLTSLSYATVGWHTVPLLALPLFGIQASMWMYARLKHAHDEYRLSSARQIAEVESKIQQVQLELARMTSIDGKSGYAA